MIVPTYSAAKIATTTAGQAAKQVQRSFFARDPETVARDILSKLIVRTWEGEQLIGRITEVEAYLGLEDPAAHAFSGRTQRNAVLFGPPGFAYVYFIYGMHYCLNFSCQPEGHPGGILIRALEPVAGISTMARLRGVPAISSPRLLTGGPGKLCQALGITRASDNGVDVTQPTSHLRVLDDGFTPSEIVATPRIGIRKAQERLLRFVAR
jgi:DNA-3-methyladenine glycosylase